MGRPPEGILDGTYEIIGSNDQEPVPDPVKDITNLPVEEIQGVQGYRLWAQVSDEQRQVLYAVASVTPGLQTAHPTYPLVESSGGGAIEPPPIGVSSVHPGKGPVRGWNGRMAPLHNQHGGGGCPQGQTRAEWGRHHYKTRDLEPIDLADIKVTAGIKADVLRLYHVELELDAAVKVKGFPRRWIRTHTKKVYRCDGRNWVFQYQSDCTAEAMSMTTTPTWAVHYTGYKDQDMSGPYSPDACN